MGIVEKRKYFLAFLAKASDSGTITAMAAEEIFMDPQFGLNCKQKDVRQVIQREHREDNRRANAADDKTTSGDVSFQIFVHALAALQRGAHLRSRQRAWLPIEPDLPFKQAWDSAILLLLLYCSFSVPYEIAFTEVSSGTSALDMWNLTVVRPPTSLHG